MNGPHISFFGRLVEDPELKYGRDTGRAYCKVPVAVNTYRGPEEPQETHYFDVFLWGHHANRVNEECRKGHMVFVHGRYSMQKREGEDGTMYTDYEVSAKEFRPLYPAGSQRQAEAGMEEAGEGIGDEDREEARSG